MESFYTGLENTDEKTYYFNRPFCFCCIEFMWMSEEVLWKRTGIYHEDGRVGSGIQ